MANSHGIGVTRNDYRRKNRKENKGHRWRGARTVPAIRLIKPTEQSPIISRTAYEDKGFLENEDVAIAEEEYDDMKSVRSTLAYDALIFYPPFLGQNEIRQRRFAETLYKGEYRRTDNAAEMNDNWWEWEEERGLESAELRIMGLEPLHENTAPPKTAIIRHRTRTAYRGKTLSVQNKECKEKLQCKHCGHNWWAQETRWQGDSPEGCPNKQCRRKDWQ